MGGMVVANQVCLGVCCPFSCEKSQSSLADDPYGRGLRTTEFLLEELSLDR